MDSQAKCFPYEKSIVINALYDTIEALGLRLDRSNSARGMLVVSEPSRTGRIRITLEPVDRTNQTIITIYPEDVDESIFATWNAIILDELSGTIHRARCAKREKSE
jgi:hypothetical protein